MTTVLPSTFFFPDHLRSIRAFLDECTRLGWTGSVRASRIADRETLAEGVLVSCEEFCLPLTILCGEASLIGKKTSDLLILPVVAGNEGCWSFPCHLQQRARDIVLNLGLLPPERILSPVFFYTDDLALTGSGYAELGSMLDIPSAVCAQAGLSLGSSAPASSSGAESVPASGALRIAVAGNAPVCAASLLGGAVLAAFRKAGAEAFAAEATGFRLDSGSRDSAHFSFDAHARECVSRSFADPSVDGVVFLQPFLCGSGSGTAQDIARLKTPKPFLPLILDQGSSAGGLETRIEAFLDMVRARKGGSR